MTTDTALALLEEAKERIIANDGRHDLNIDLLKRIAALLESGGWILVKDRLPEKHDGDSNGYVLQCWSGLSGAVVAHYTQVVRAVTELDPFPDHKWQPLPPLPKGE